MFKSNKTKKIIIALAILSVVSIFFVILSRNKASENKPSPDQIVNPPKIPNNLKNEGILNFDVSNIKKFDLPNKLPLITETNNKEISKQEALHIASKLGLNFEPNTINDISNGIIYIWNGDEYLLQITPKTKQVFYSTINSPRIYINSSTTKPYSDEELLQKAKEDVSRYLNIEPDNLNFSGYKYLELESGYELFKEVPRESSQLIQLNFSKSPINYPVYTLNPDKPEIYIHYTKSGQLITLEANLTTELSIGKIEYKIKSFEEFKQEIQKSVVVSIENVNIPDINTKDLGTIKVETVSLVYLLTDPKETYLQPVFLIQGTTNIKGYSNNVTVKLYLPALSGSI